MTGPPIPPSKRTKSKLKAFQFIDGAPPAEEEKENQCGTPDKQRQRSCETLHNDKLHENVSMTVSPLAPPPSTPATRLPLALLVGNSDDYLRKGPIDDSPEDLVYWHHNVSPRSSMANVITPAQLRGKKRARSSSPVTSSQQDKSGFLCDRDPLKPIPIHATLTTPQADPAADLWNKYSLNGEGSLKTPASKIDTIFSHLINESSPRSSATAGSVGGLRRWASCGVAWPTSKSKRRRLAGTFRSSKGDSVVENESGMNESKPVTTKAERLLERIQETLADDKRRKVSALPSSSSPSANTYRTVEKDVESPLQRKRRSQRPPSQEHVVKRSPLRLSPAVEKAVSSSSSDYGDDDIDLDVVAAMNDPLARLAAKEPAGRTSEIRTSQPLDTCAVSSLHAPPQPTNDVFSSDDEFGDEDLFNDEADALAAACDSAGPPPAAGPPRLASKPAHVFQSQRSVSATKDSLAKYDASDDEFGGDDIDDDHFVAAVNIATQQGKVLGGTQASVRIWS
ncbi:hypothetical protein EJ05DRAFT_194274 [Pseudovirgaria hyperparasitica]|uniref:Uncharacterized protein n=1 Tax=Pseudovirgaria hyperparasitica TaxID=470096 RepID=A0A6A6WK02_9PEZI|nr:uncharacterized protein EJ05DRAFT_194274 [Pseudovirgaria hyperparasitica]KAF2762011.1 hypothetical protein EJ05DRAFT_194274 [Pseudovirgaria hyperparasitica]